MVEPMSQLQLVATTSPTARRVTQITVSGSRFTHLTSMLITMASMTSPMPSMSSWMSILPTRLEVATTILFSST
jgi:hypothetical protein